MWDIVLYDYILDQFLTRPGLQRRVPPSHVSTDLALPDWLRKLAVVAPVVGLSFFVVNVHHICGFVQKQKTKKLEEIRHKESGKCPLEIGCRAVDEQGNVGRVIMINDDPYDRRPVKFSYESGGHSDWMSSDSVRVYVEKSNPWHLDKSAEMTLMVIMMPAVFMVMALRAEIRVLQIFLGTSFKAGDDWELYALWRRCTYMMDLQCAAGFQYLTVVAFALLCAEFFDIEYLARQVEIREKHLIMTNNMLMQKLQTPGTSSGNIESSSADDIASANKEHRFSLTWAGLQGLWAYIVVGFMRCMFGVAMAGLMELKSHKYQHLLLQVLDKYQPVFVFSAILCIYNWSIIQRIQDLKRPEALGRNATLKFIAVRLLLLIGDGQQGVLQGSVGRQWMHLSEPQGELLHVILLILECALVVAWNRLMWKDRVVHPIERVRRIQSGASASLLPS
eukprot:CAMPEP_0204603884 /NCGR_PEP_ID=MMETSP0661-20131031/57522_1 /ASSEMBLY_ACC=CAM_ASM_000606 /TAXON_ID=109239 /ORGANISM="Alexandrium margalefi, Strain AMGDE01CS-322" /LENGTH=447 /DNA_ID=CAMNT_0051614993 /DNA_START=238 /DNA_END=1581 /DNA_ORIENTATION=+